MATVYKIKTIGNLLIIVSQFILDLRKDDKI